MTANGAALGYIRTFVPYGVGVVLGWLLLHTGLNLHGGFEAGLDAVLVAAVINVYYIVIRLVEEKEPAIGVLLGATSRPVYEDVSDLWNSFVRTAIPTLVSAIVLGILATVIHLDPVAQANVIALGVGVVSAAYYAAARAVAHKWPGLNFLLKDAPAAYTK
jgi:hypothetical protein